MAHRADAAALGEIPVGDLADLVAVLQVVVLLAVVARNLELVVEVEAVHMWGLQVAAAVAVAVAED